MANNTTFYTPTLNETGSGQSTDLFQRHIMTFLAFYIVIVIFGLFGNFVVVVTVLLNPTMRSVTYSLMIALAVCDFIFLIISPFHVHGAMFYPGHWPLEATGNAGCKMYYYVLRALYAFSVIILMIITVERFLAVRFPLKFREQKVSASVLICGAITLALIVVAPELHGISIDYYNSLVYCGSYNWDNDEQRRNYYIFVYLFLYLIPLFLMLILYTLIWVTLRKAPPSMVDKGQKRISRRRRMANMLFLVVVGFFVCWTPWNIVESIGIFSSNEQTDEYYVWMSFAMLPVFASSAINPIVYGFMSEEMRNNAISIFHRRGHVRVSPEGQTVVSQ